MLEELCPAYLVAIYAWHHDIKKDNIGQDLCLRKKFKCLVTIHSLLNLMGVKLKSVWCESLSTELEYHLYRCVVQMFCTDLPLYNE